MIKIINMKTIILLKFHDNFLLFGNTKPTELIKEFLFEELTIKTEVLSIEPKHNYSVKSFNTILPNSTKDIILEITIDIPNTLFHRTTDFELITYIHSQLNKTTIVFKDEQWQGNTQFLTIEMVQNQ